MLPLPRFALHNPTTLVEAAALLRELGADTHIIAGGTDILPNMKQGLLAPRHVVSLQSVSELRGVRVEGGAIHIGAMTSLDAIARDNRVREAARVLAEAAGTVGGPHHRRMGTLGGNICLDTRCQYYNQTYFWREALGFCLKKDGTVCHVVEGGQKCVAAASNDSAPALAVLDAKIHLVSSRGARTLDARSFYTSDGIKNTVREPDEIVTGVSVPVHTGRRTAYEKLRRRNSIDFPLLSIAARADWDGERLLGVDLVVSALAARPRRVSAAQKITAGSAPGNELLAALSQAAYRECRPLDNVEGDASWRHEMVPVVVARALRRVGIGEAR